MNRATVDAYASYSTGFATPARASWAYSVEPKYAQNRLVHADISVTLNTYTHVLPDKRAEVAKRIEEAIV